MVDLIGSIGLEAFLPFFKEADNQSWLLIAAVTTAVATPVPSAVMGGQMAAAECLAASPHSRQWEGALQIISTQAPCVGEAWRRLTHVDSRPRHRDDKADVTKTCKIEALGK